MADGYWGRQSAPPQPSPMAKRPRSDYDLPGGGGPAQESYHYLPRDDNHSGFYRSKDTKSIEESYDRYLQNVQRPSFGPGQASNFNAGGIGNGVGGGMPDLGGGMHSHRYGESGMMHGSGLRAVGEDFGYGRDHPREPIATPCLPGREMLLPPDASNTLFVEGLPCNISQREVAHIFRPFLGYKEVRLVTKGPKRRDADPVVLCFVAFEDAPSAMVASTALQGYKIDEKDPESANLRLQFAKYPSRKSRSRGKK